MLEWEGVTIVKFIKVSLTDEHFKILLRFLSHRPVQTLLVTKNMLTKQALKTLRGVDCPSLKKVIMANNQIMKKAVHSDL